jgi:hypothetical protein
MFHDSDAHGPVNRGSRMIKGSDDAGYRFSKVGDYMKIIGGD